MSVVIPFHARDGAANPSANQPSVLQAVTALQSCTQRPKEIICVDDNSTLTLRKQLESLGAKYLPTPGTATKPHTARRALARQTGADMAAFERILFVDSDILMNSHALLAVWNALVRGGLQTVAFVPRRESAGLSRNLTDDSPMMSLKEYGTQDKRRCVVAYTESQECDQVWAAQSSHCFGVHRQFLARVGGWDTSFVGWGEEDSELFYRFYKFGGAFQVLDGAKYRVTHLTHDVDHKANYQSFKRNAQYFIKKFPEVAVARRDFYVRHGILPATEALCPNG
ncbi:MAG: glycosyltransferase family 2 protein [Planctomycetota bacterium]